MANIYGRQVVIPLTNKSGGSVIAGDVVVVDTGNNDAFTTTTSAGFTGGVGIAQESIASNASGRVLIGGYAALVNVNASVTRGDFGKTHTVAKQATDAGATRGAGTFCQFLTGGTTPDALMYPVDLLGSSLTNPMTTKGDVILGDTGGTPTRLAAGTAGYLLSSAGAAAFPVYIAPAGLILGSSSSTNAAVTTASTTLADMDASRIVVTFTAPASTNVLVTITCRCSPDNGGTGVAGDQLFFGVRESTTNIAGPSAVARLEVASAVINDFRWITYIVPVLGISAGSHTYKGAFAITNAARDVGWVQEAAAEPATMIVQAL